MRRGAQPLSITHRRRTKAQVHRERPALTMRRANTAILCERYLTPTIKEIIDDLNEATVL